MLLDCPRSRLKRKSRNELAMVDDFKLENGEPKYFSSSKVMEVVRKLGFELKYKVCETFFNLMVEEGWGMIVRGV